MGLKLPTSRSAAIAGVAIVVAVGAVGGGMALAASPHKAAAVTVGVKKTSLGMVLDAGPKHLTVYEFTKDHGKKSACTGGCLKIWPAVTVSATGMPKAGPGVSASKLGTAKEGKTTQVTYNGHLLYYFASDKNASAVAGQGVEGTWWALSAKGAKISKKPASSTSTGSSTNPAGGGSSTTPASEWS